MSSRHLESHLRSGDVIHITLSDQGNATEGRAKAQVPALALVRPQLDATSAHDKRHSREARTAFLCLCSERAGKAEDRLYPPGRCDVCSASWCEKTPALGYRALRCTVVDACCCAMLSEITSLTLASLEKSSDKAWCRSSEGWAQRPSSSSLTRRSRWQLWSGDSCVFANDPDCPFAGSTCRADQMHVSLGRCSARTAWVDVGYATFPVC